MTWESFILIIMNATLVVMSIVHYRHLKWTEILDVRLELLRVELGLPTVQSKDELLAEAKKLLK